VERTESGRGLPYTERKKYKNRLRNWWYFKRIVLGRWLKRFWLGFLETGHESISLIFMPHGAEQKVYRLRISKFVLFFVSGIMCIIVVYSIHAFQNAGEKREQIVKLDSVSSEQDLLFRQYSTRSAKLMRAMEPAEEELEKLAALLGAQNPAAYVPDLSGADEAIPAEMAEEYGSDFFFTEELQQLGAMNIMLRRNAELIARIDRFVTHFRRGMRRVPSSWPVTGGGGVITSAFGYRVNPFSGVYGLHTGIDIAYVRGAYIRAAAPGTVTQAEVDRGYGLAVLVKHDFGFTTRYAHLDESFVIEGLTVERGEPIGTMGDSGNTTGVHLHYEVLIDGQPVDPGNFLRMLF
jgi:murein DD-endopeptidase MepM/ murein hydrolase activator NlpD